MDPNGTIKLLGAILWRRPNLPGAAGQGHHGLYEDVAREDRGGCERSGWLRPRGCAVAARNGPPAPLGTRKFDLGIG